MNNKWILLFIPMLLLLFLAGIHRGDFARKREMSYRCDWDNREIASAQITIIARTMDCFFINLWTGKYELYADGVHIADIFNCSWDSALTHVGKYFRELASSKIIHKFGHVFCSEQCVKSYTESRGKIERYNQLVLKE